MKSQIGKSKIFRLASILFAVLILMSCTVGCKGGDTGTPDTGGENSDTVTTTTNVNNNLGGEQGPIGDSDSTTVTTVSGSADSVTTAPPVTNSGKLFSSPVTFTLMTYEHPSQKVNGESIKFKAMTEATNVTLKLNITAQANYTTKVTAALASGALSDITWVRNDQMQKYGSSGIFMDLTPHLETKLADYYRLVKNDESWARTKVNGKVYAFTTLSAGYYIPGMDPAKRFDDLKYVNGVMPIIRYDILEKHNMQLPTTFDEWFETMKALKALYPESAPWCSRGNGFGVINNMTRGMTGYIANLHYNDNLKEYTFGFLHEEFREAVEFLRSCWEEGIMENTWSSNANRWNDNIIGGKSFFWYDNMSFAVTQNEQLLVNNPDAKLMVMPLMANEDGERWGQLYASWYEQIYVLNAKSSKKEELLKFMNWCYSDEGYYVMNYGQEGVTYTKNADGSVTIPESLTKRYEKNSSPFYAYDSDMGTGLLSFTPFFVSSYDNKALVDGLVKAGALDLAYLNEQSEIVSADIKKGYYRTLPVDVQVDAANIASVNTREDAIYALSKKYIFGFIDGSISMTEWDSFIAQVKQLGAQQVLDAYNAALKKAK